MANAALILINGLSGTGKSNLAERLAGDIRLPLINNDAIKEVLFDTLGWSDLEWSDRLGITSSHLLWLVTRSLLTADQSLIIESAFHAEHDGPRLAKVKEEFAPRVAEIHCVADRRVLAERVKERAESGERHPGHGDQDEQALHEEVIPEVLTDPDPLLEAPDYYIVVNTEEITDEKYREMLGGVQTFLAGKAAAPEKNVRQQKTRVVK
jgi:predicted kinase